MCEGLKLKNVLVIHPIHQAGIDLLKSRNDINVEVTKNDSESELIEQIKDANAITVRHTRITKPVIDAASNLEIVSRHGVGCDNLDIKSLAQRGIPVSVTGDASSNSVAEHTLYLMLAVARCGNQADQLVRTGGKFGGQSGLEIFELRGKSVFIIGFGRIGRRVAQMCNAFGMRISVFDPEVQSCPENDFAFDWMNTLDEGLAAADFVTLHAPLTDKTYNLIDPKSLSTMKAGAVLINTARGELIDEAALFDALKSHRLRGAGLDVFKREPPSPDNPLFQLSNVHLTPHVSALTEEARRNMAITTAQNILDCFDGKLRQEMLFKIAAVSS
jgi:D-3-phosphoglycerate dehydrogenase